MPNDPVPDDETLFALEDLWALRKTDSRTGNEINEALTEAYRRGKRTKISPIQQQIFHALALAICEHHKRTCDGATCNIPLMTIREMAEAAGAVFTEAERKEFM